MENNPAANSPWSCTTTDLKPLQIWVWSSDDSSRTCTNRSEYWSMRQRLGFMLTVISSYRVQQCPAPVGGLTAGELQPDTGSSHWTEPGPGGWRVVPGTGTAVKHRFTLFTFKCTKRLYSEYLGELCVKYTCTRFSAIWVAVCRVWLSWESRLLWTEVLSPTPFSWVISEFCCDGVCPMAAKEVRSRSVRERILSQTDSSSRDWHRCWLVSCLHKEDERVDLGYEGFQTPPLLQTILWQLFRTSL